MSPGMGHPPFPLIFASAKNTLKVPKLVELAREHLLCSLQYVLRVSPHGEIGNAQFEEQQGNVQAIANPV